MEHAQLSIAQKIDLDDSATIVKTCDSARDV